MNDNQNINDDQMLILAYIYGDLSAEQRQAFEQRLQSEVELKKLFEQQNAFDKLMPGGTQPVINDDRLHAVQWSLQKRLRKESNRQRTLSSRIKNMLQALWSQPVSFGAQLVGMLLTFSFGFLLAQSNSTESISGEPLASHTELRSPLQLIESDNYEIVDLQLKQLEPQSDKVKVVYSLASKAQVQGSITDPEIQNLLAASIKNDVSDSTRLDIIEALKDQGNRSLVKDALSYSLLNDPNPGVRMAAAESLAKLSDNEAVREVLRQALSSDINSGIRVAAFQALIQHLDDQKTIETLKSYSLKDSNQYIRDFSKRVINDNKNNTQLPVEKSPDETTQI
ncbi:HEAT repeat domain-containing protein [Aliikangiella coralliicola]|uniref:HEAT repeat domain-containing protein n=1 Tax=Aliikangiella coralliicola TaxID=2592383 RepID=A0A545UG44_9GAMM|nr:HEAT repeat domain-containing protein [Aliikangiella coralliicola]TQV88440.1 HEAT repeat domain-containing protein [Aliikangiella coralliicola]